MENSKLTLRLFRKESCSRILCRTALFNDADPLKLDVKGEELGVRGGEGSSWTGTPAGSTCAIAGQTRYQCWCSPENKSTMGDMNL
ncbi:hypothetical protein DPMN_087557 [Dreissena polymorpha]|uniref:Uncharacterized protein n=1 Tax=Dreissena polymorpha TaxID=45954 RepID=A0A9D4QVL5_DREPO|nr:hypothetical protein DPMN_087557 [Dreissena polymorpha]